MALVQRLEAQAVLERERARIAGEATSFGLQGVDESFIKTTTTSSILSTEEVNSIIEAHAQKAAAVIRQINKLLQAPLLKVCWAADWHL